MRVKLAIVQSFCQTFDDQSLKKTFLLADFLNQFYSRNNQTKTLIKKYILQQFVLLEKHRIIQNQVVLIAHDFTATNHDIKQLNVKIFNHTTLIHFYEIL